MTFNQYTYTLKQLRHIAKTMPIGYLEERQARADYVEEFIGWPDESLYYYRENAEEHFRSTYGKYVVSELVALDFEVNSSPARKIPKRISGCCDRADQY